MPGVTLLGPVFPYRGGIPYCTTRLADELGCEVISFRRQFPRMFYPGSGDVDESLRPKTPARARFLLDVVNPLTWLRTGLLLRRERPDALIVVWWVWVWALPYLVILALLPRSTRVVLQCHNVGDKEPAAWKRWLTDRVLRRGDVLVVHAKTEAEEASRRTGGRVPVVATFLPVHEMGGPAPPREEARRRLGLSGNVALCFGHIRPYKGVDVALRAWPMLRCEATLLVAGEVWWKQEEAIRELARGLANVRMDLRYVPDAEIAEYFAAADVVLAPYRVEAQSGVALTALHFGRPLIASTVGGLPEVVEEGGNGFLIPPDDPAALAAAVDRFFLSADRGAMERAAAASGARYSWEEYGVLFRSLLEPPEMKNFESRMKN